MSTTPLSDPQSMPLQDLKQAAGLATPAAPEPAAVNPTPAAPAPVAPPWGQVEKADDGTYQVTLATGEVFKGTADEVIAKQAEAQYNTKRWGQDWKQKAEAAQPAQPAAPVTQPEPVDPAVQATRDWLIAEQAAAMGMTPDEYKARVSMVFQTTEQMAQNIAFTEFHRMCPDYVDTPENSAALSSYFADGYRPANAEQFAADLKQAYALAVYEKKIVPQASAPATTTTPRPPAMPISAPSPTGSGDQSAWSMPLGDLKKAAGLG